MPYGVLLKQLLKKNKLTYTKLSSKCSELGVSLNSGYIKEIANGKRNPPTEEKTRAIAKILNTDERLLILEGYIDKAPTEVLQLFNTIRECSLLPALASLKNTLSKDQYDIISYEVSKMPLAELLLEFLEPIGLNYSNNKDFSLYREGLNFTINADKLTMYVVSDNSMSPKLEKNDIVNLEIQDKYINGEIIAFKIKGYKDIIYRMALFSKDTITLTPYNNEFKTITYNLVDIEILGRVSKIIREL